MKVKPSVALIVGIILAVVMALQYVIWLPVWAHIAISTVVAILGIYGFTAASPAVISSAIPPRALAVIAALVAGFSGVLVLIPVGSTWHGILAAALAVLASVIPSVVPQSHASAVVV